MSRIKYFIICWIAFSSCNSNTTGPARNNQTEIDSINDPRVTKSKDIIFVPYLKTGLILPTTLKLFDSNYKEVTEISRDSILQVEIIAKSTEKQSSGNDETVCNKSDYLKIVYQDKEYLVFGKYVYEIIKSQLFKVSKSAEDFEIFPVSNFQIKAYEEDFGLTGCETESYNIPVIKRMSDNHYSLLKNQGVRNPAPLQQVPYAVLLMNTGVEEKIQNVTAESDTLVLQINTTFQMADGSYKLKIIYDDFLSESFMTDITEKMRE